MTAGTLTMWSPQSTSSGSIMPGYKWLFDNEPLDISIEAKMKMQTPCSIYLMLKLLMLKKAIQLQSQKLK
jgi:cytochrome c oxidase cbb3-type subunit I/II